jgi:hypothetical protein
VPGDIENLAPMPLEFNHRCLDRVRHVENPYGAVYSPSGDLVGAMWAPTYRVDYSWVLDIADF